MNRGLFVFSAMLLGTLVLATGCATKGQHRRDITNLQNQVGNLQAEVARLDQAVRDSGASVQAAQQGASSQGTGAPSLVSGDAVYRTPSGFELPATSIQRALKNAGYYQGNVDGKIGSQTKEALRNFQRDHDLTADGVCGRQTWAALKSFA